MALRHLFFALLVLRAAFAWSGQLSVEECEERLLFRHEVTSHDYAAEYHALDANSDVTWTRWDFTGTSEPLARYGMAYGLLKGEDSKSEFVIYGGQYQDKKETIILDDLWTLKVDGSAKNPGWADIGTTQTPRPGNLSNSAFTTWKNQYLIIYGGLVGSYSLAGTYVKTPVQDLWVYDSASRAWTPIETQGRAPDVTWGASAAIMNDTLLVITGGYSHDFPNALAQDTWYLPLQDALLNLKPKWAQVTSHGGFDDAPPPALGTCLATTADMSLVRFGGSPDPSTFTGSSSMYALSLESAPHQPASSKKPVWRQITSGQADLSPYFHSCVLNLGGMLVVFGGIENPTKAYSNLLTFSPIFPQLFEAVTTAAGMMTPLPRRLHAAVPLPSNFLLIYGGQTGEVENASDPHTESLHDVWTVLMATPIDPRLTKVAACPMALYAGVDDQCTIDARDTWGLPTGAKQFEAFFRVEINVVALDGSTSSQAPPPVKYLSANTFKFPVQSLIAGNMSIRVYYNNTLLGFNNKPLVIKVAAGIIAASESFLECPEGNGTTSVVVNIPSTCVIHSRDAFNNPSGLTGDEPNYQVRVSQGCLPSLYQMPVWRSPGEFFFNVTAIGNNTFITISVIYHGDVIGSTDLHPNPINILVQPNRCFADVFSIPVPNDKGNCTCIEGYQRNNLDKCSACSVGQRKDYVADCCCTCESSYYNLTSYYGSLVTCFDIEGKDTFKAPERTFPPPNPCVRCPSCLQCEVGTPPSPAIGYWSGKNRSLVYECLSPACLGGIGNPCDEGYEGPLCALCQDNYSGFGSSCSPCGSQGLSITFLVAQLIAVLVVVTFLVITANRPKSRLSILPKILLNYIQTIGLLGLFRFHWPKVATDVAHAISSTTLASQSHLYSCALRRLDHFEKLTIYLLMVAAIVGPGLLIFSIRYGGRFIRRTYRKCTGTKTLRFIPVLVDYDDEEDEPVSSSQPADYEPLLQDQAQPDDDESEDDDEKDQDEKNVDQIVALEANPLSASASLYQSFRANLALLTQPTTSAEEEQAQDAEDKLGKSKVEEPPSSLDPPLSEDPTQSPSVAVVVENYTSTWWHTYSSICLVFLFLVYPLVSSMIIQTLVPCVEIDGNLFLPADLSISCDSPRFQSWYLGCWVLLAFFTSGVLLFTFLLLFKNRKRLDTLRTRSRFMFLYDGYRPERWYWELVISARKIGISLLASFLASRPRAQSFLGIAWLNVSLWVQVLGAPFREARLNNLEISALMMSTGTLISSLFYEDGVHQETIFEQALTYVIIVVNGLFLLLMVVLIVIEAVLYVKQKAGNVIKFVKKKLKRNKPKELKNVIDSETPGNPLASAAAAQKTT